MADKETTVKLGGLPWRANEESAVDAIKAGGQVITPEQAAQSQAAQNDLSYVDQNWGAAGKFGMGVGSGLTLGLGPGALAGLGILDPGHLQAAQTSGLYTGGEVAGTVIPALFSGGESLAGRSAVGRALSATPAGLMNMGGSLAERLTGRVLGEEAGVLGRLALTPAKMAARGAFEGAAINLGHTVGDSLIDNKPLSAEALWASGVDGALGGGLLGGSLGTVGAIGSKAVESLGAIGKSAVSKSGIGEATALKRVGYDAGDIERASASKGGRLGQLKAINGILEDGGVKLSDSTEKIKGGVTNAKETYKGAIRDVATELDDVSQVSITPERIAKRLDAVNAQHMTTAEGSTVNNLVESLKSDLDNTFYEKTPAGSFKTRLVTDPETGLMRSERIARAQKWGDWIGEGKNLDQLRARVADLINNVEEVNPGRGFRQQIKAQLMDQVENEVHSAIEAVDPAMADKWASARTNMRIASELEESLGKKAAKDLLNTKPAVTNEDLAGLVTMTAFGHPVTGLGVMMAKSVGRQLPGRLEPAIAQMAMDNAIGTKAAAATQHATGRIANSITNFFKGAGKTPARAGMAASQKHKGEGLTRAKYEEMASRMEQLVSENHQDKVRRYAESLHDMGYQDFAKSLMDTNNRAVQYGIWIQPPRGSAKSLTGLKPHVVSKIPSTKEFKHARQVSYITEPFKILDDMESGSLSRDGVRAFKYVYPEMHSQIVQQAMMKVVEMKQKGGFLPMEKIASLGIALDAPIDSTLTPEYIGAVQMALNTPSQPGPEPSPSTGDAHAMAQSLMTPLQKLGV